MSDRVTITRTPGAKLASFQTINASQSQMVFWTNRDHQPHWPTFSTGNPPPATPYQVGARGNSGSLQPATALAQFYPSDSGPIPIPQGQAVPVNYTCQLHQGETGTINCYADLYSVANQLSPATRGQAYTANLTNGGLPPYEFRVTNSNLPASLTVKNVANQGPVLQGTPAQGDAGDYAFDLTCQDSDGGNVVETFLLTVA